MFLAEVLAVVLKNETIVLDADCRFGCASVVGILKKFRQNVARALNLLKQLVPRSREFGIASSCSQRAAAFARIRSKKHGAPIIWAAPHGQVAQRSCSSRW